MKSNLATTTGLVILLLSTAVAEPPRHLPRYDFETFRARMEDPGRAQWQKPDEVVHRLQLRPGQRVADIGAGTGYFTALLARAVGSGGRVYAVDIDPQAVRYMRDRFRGGKFRQVRVIQATPDDPKLPRPVDLIFVCDTWHHIDDRAAYARQLRRYLTKHGRLVVVDFKVDADPNLGPPREMRLSPEQIADELRQSGFTVTYEPDFLPQQYVLTAVAAAPAGH